MPHNTHMTHMAALNTPIGSCACCGCACCAGDAVLGHMLPEAQQDMLVDASHPDVIHLGHIIMHHVGDRKFRVYTHIIDFPASKDPTVNPRGLVSESMWVSRTIGPFESSAAGSAAMMAALHRGENDGVGYLANSPSSSSELRWGDMVSYSGGSAEAKPKFAGVLRHATAA